MLTKQSEKDLTDVNLIMDSWVQTGAAVAGHLNPAPGSYGDFSSGIDYHEAMSAVRDAELCFAALPAKVRSHCENDPGKFLEMVYDPDRRDELEALGIVEEAKVAAEPVVKSADSSVSDDGEEEPVAPSKSPDVERVRDVPRGEAKRPDPAGDLFD